MLLELKTRIGCDHTGPFNFIYIFVVLSLILLFLLQTGLHKPQLNLSIN